MGKDGKPVTEVQEIQVPAFKIVSVFDVSQTEGEPLPSIGVEELTGSVERYGEFFKALEQTSPVPIGFEDIPGGSHGYYIEAAKTDSGYRQVPMLSLIHIYACQNALS